MIWSSQRSVRSWLSPVTVLLGVPWALIGVWPVATGQAVGDMVIGAVITLTGLVLMWGGFRMGAFARPGGLVVRQGFTSDSAKEMFRGKTYRCEEIQGVGVTEAEHHALPVMMLYPTLRLVDGSDAPLRSLGTFRFLPRSDAHAWRAAQALAHWVGKPLVTVAPDGRPRPRHAPG